MTLIFKIFIALAFSIFISASTHASDLDLTPPSISIGGEKFVPVDIESSTVRWTIESIENSENKKIKVEAEIAFHTNEEGYPFLLLNPDTKVVTSTGKQIPVKKMTALKKEKSNYFYLSKKGNKAYSPGRHEEKLSYSFEYKHSEHQNLLPAQYSRRNFVEMGIPANAMYDRFKVDLSIAMENAKNYKVFANGKVSRTGDTFNVSFPPYFTSISFFIDLVEKDQYLSKSTDLITTSKEGQESEKGRKLKLVVYQKDVPQEEQPAVQKRINAFMTSIEQTFLNLEKKYGPYPHFEKAADGKYPFGKKLFVNISGKKKGTGSFAGAMSLSPVYIEHLEHELSHHWFLQSISPLNGADIWLYEGFGFIGPYLGFFNGPEKVENLKESFELSQGTYSIWSNEHIFTNPEYFNPHQSGSVVMSAINNFIKKKETETAISEGVETSKLPRPKGITAVLRKIYMSKTPRHRTMSTAQFKDLIRELGTEIQIGDGQGNFRTVSVDLNGIENIFEYYFKTK